MERKFITSPANIEVHRKVELQDADITEDQQNAFKDLCTEFHDIFPQIQVILEKHLCWKLK